jgi:hypothetical protein
MTGQPGKIGYNKPDEKSDKTGTACALSDTFISADRLGGEGLPHGAPAHHGQRATKIVNYAIA